MRIAFLNVAHLHAEAYIHNLCRVAGVEICGVADENTGRGQDFSQRHELPWFDSYERLLDTCPDGVLVCSENTRHAPLVRLAAQRGVHVLCEKPLCTVQQDGIEMVAACQQSGAMLMTAFPMRFSAPLMELKRQLDHGGLGRILCFNAYNQGELPLAYPWFTDPLLSGGGAVMDHTVHLADVMRWYTGSEVVEVYAQANRIFHADKVGVETGGLVMLTFEDGTFASIDCSWSRPIGSYPSWGGLGFEMITGQGTISADAFRQNLTVYREDLQRGVWDYWGSDPNQAMINEFIAAIRQKRAPAVTGMDGLRATEIVLAAYESIRLGQPIKMTVPV
jgi:predicted dehydrogenase